MVDASLKIEGPGAGGCCGVGIVGEVAGLSAESTLDTIGQMGPAYRAVSDPVIGPALRHLHNDPAHPWTVAALASCVGISRAALAHRFADLVGQPPMSYLTDWRLDLAAGLLQEPEATIDSAAGQVGYSSASALSAAFKRERGISPRDLRAQLDSTI